MPDLDGLNAMLPLPLWAAAAVLVVLLVTCIMAVRRSGSARSVAALFSVPALVVIAWSAWSFVDYSILRQRAAEREALEARALQLTTAAMMPGSALACLEAVAGEAVEGPCEKAVFSNPSTVAAASAYMEAKLRLFADSVNYSRRANGAYDGSLASLRQAIETDRYGFVAHVLATRDGCTSDACDAFALLRDASAVKANLAAQAYENRIERYAASWPGAKEAAPPVARAPSAQVPAFATLSSVPMTKPIDFPGAASIPPVSIMTSEPEVPAPATAEAAPSRAASPPPPRRPANGAAPARAAPPASAPAPAARPQ
jgi:hypothetical protein